MTVDELVEAWRKGMEDPSKDETAREHWLRGQLVAAEARGYARAREQAQGIADAYADEMRAAGRDERAEGVDTVSERICDMKDEGGE